MYGLEVWGLDCIEVLPDSNDKFKSTEKLSCEKFNLSFYRLILDVHRKSQNSAVRGDLRRMPLGLDVVANMINYQNHLESKHPNTYFVEAWITNSTVPNDKGKTMSWAQHCKEIQFIQHSAGNHTVDFTDRKSIKQCLGQQYSLLCDEKINEEPQTRCYKLFKAIFARNNICSLNIRNKLAIERGRYTKPLTPASDRVCINYIGNKVEDE